MEFSLAGHIFTLRAPIFNTVIDIWSHTNWEMVTNNLTAVIEVTLIEVVLSEALLYLTPSVTTYSHRG